jgi:hypothetical protein
VRQTLLAVEHCHERGVCHRDLKPQNLLILKPCKSLRSATIKVVDFGVSRTFAPWPNNRTGAESAQNNRAMTRLIGTVAYMAPEIFARRGYGPGVDLWAVGVILYQMLSGQKPFRSQRDVQCSEPSFAEPVWAHISPPCRAALARLLERDPQRRTAAREALAMPWVLGADARRPDPEPSRAPLPGSDAVVASIRAQVGARRLKQSLARLLADRCGVAGGAALRKQFARMDRNGDGYIDAGELRAAFREGGQSGLCAGVEAALQAADVDGDCRLSYREVMFAALTRALCQQEAQHRALTEEMLQAAGLDAGSAQRVVSAADRDGDGGVSGAELGILAEAGSLRQPRGRGARSDSHAVARYTTAAPRARRRRVPRSAAHDAGATAARSRARVGSAPRHAPLPPRPPLRDPAAARSRAGGHGPTPAAPRGGVEASGATVFAADVGRLVADYEAAQEKGRLGRCRGRFMKRAKALRERAFRLQRGNSVAQASLSRPMQALGSLGLF